MALEKTPVNIPFAQGVDTKTDPKQIPLGKFQNLVNTVFNKGNLLQKRPGFQKLATISGASTITTYDDGLVMIGDSVQAYAPINGMLVNSGDFFQMDVSAVSLVRRATSQTTVDVAVADNGVTCSVWLDANANCYYQISDSSNSQTIVPATLITGAFMPRAFVLGRNFIVTFLTASTNLKFIAIPIMQPGSPGAAVTFASTASSTAAAYDGYVANNSLYLSWDASDGGGAIRTAYLSNTLVVSAPVVIAGQAANLISVTADITGSSPVIWVSFYKSSTNTIKVRAYNPILVTILTTTTAVSSITINEITSCAHTNVLTLFYEVNNTYTFSSVKTDYLSKNTVTIAGVVGSASVLLRGVGLGSKALYDSTQGHCYMLATYGQTLQPTYFLIDESANVIAKIAYSNGGGYAINQILPALHMIGESLYVGYLFKDLLAAVNKTQGVTNINGVYSQTGINVAIFSFETTDATVDIGHDLHISGGFLWMFDGVKPVEHGFFVYPEDLGISGTNTSGSMSAQIYFYKATYEWTDNQGNIHRSAPSVPQQFEINAPIAFTGDRTSGSAVIVNVSDMGSSGIQVGQYVTGTGIPANTYILSIDSATQITLSNNASSGSGTSTTFTPAALTSVIINVPTLRQTYKTSNLVRIVLYRWSTAQQSYYRVTSISSPTLNSTTVDSVAITDSQSDAQILGNDLIYTTGGVVENISPPAVANSLALFKNRLLFIYGEDRNLIGYSKEVVQNTPAEFSDLFTMFVAPTTGAQGSTGPTNVVFAMDDKILLFKNDAIYYVTGNGPDNTGGNNDFSEPIFITSTVGCGNPRSVVLTPLGVMFQSNKGIWILRRNLQTDYIGAPVDAFNDRVVTSAVTVPGTNQIRFTLDDRATLMYDYYYNEWNTFYNLPAVSSTIFQELHTYLNSFGQIMQQDPTSYMDGSSPVLVSFETGWINVAGLQGFERAYFFYFLAQYFSPHKLLVQIAYDYNPNPSQSLTITPNNFSGDYGSDTLYGSNNYGGVTDKEQWRVFFEQQKCQAFKLYVQEFYDPSLGASPGAGFSMSGLDLVIGIKDGKPRLQASESAG